MGFEINTKLLMCKISVCVAWHRAEKNTACRSLPAAILKSYENIRDSLSEGYVKIFRIKFGEAIVLRASL